MPFTTGGITEEWGLPHRALLEVMREIRAFNGRRNDDDFVVDIAFRTCHNLREPEEPYGVSPGMVGRKQRRFIVWHSVPKGLDTPPALRCWLTEALVDTERLVREYLPTKSKAYPSEDLANEVAQLRAHLRRLDE